MNFVLKSVAVAALSLTLSSAFAQKGETVKIALIDPQTSLMGPLGMNQMRSWQFFAEKFSATNPAGVKFEVVAFDNKLSPAESLNAFKAALDQGVRYIAQGNGSSVAGALIDAVNKHNERNPGKEVIFLNYAAVDPDFTNSKCSYWHFRFDADTSMKREAMTTFMKEQKDVKNVYLLNQNYSHGQQVAKFAPVGQQAWADFDTRIETIRVKGRPDVQHTVRRTRHGPVISDVPGRTRDLIETDLYALALRWTVRSTG